MFGSTLTVGDKVNVSGTLSTYNGLLEITSPSVTVVSSGNTVAPVVKTISQINTDYEDDNTLQGYLVKIENATVTKIDGSNTTISQGENTIIVRGISGVTLSVNDIVTLTGNIGCYNAAQIANPTDIIVTTTCATPVFSPAEGAVTSGTQVTISSATEGATIYYTTDGSEPTSQSMQYSGAISVSSATTIKAIAVKDGCNNSEVATAVYTIVNSQVAIPAFSPAAGTYNSAQTVTLSTTTSAATIYYTTDGSEPTTSSTEYEEPITVNKTTTIKAIAVKEGMVNSEVATAVYTIKTVQPTGDQFVKITSTDDLTDGDYLIVYEEGNLAFNGGLATLDAANNTIGVTITEGAIAKDDDNFAAIVTIATVDGGYSIKAANGQFIGHKGTKNTLDTSDEAIVNTISFDTDGNPLIACGDYTMYFNSASDQMRFRYFKNAQKAIALYKYAGTPVVTPSIKLTQYEYNLNAQGGDTELPVTCTNMPVNPQLTVVFVASDGETSATYDWISATINANGNIDGHIDVNTGEARTAYFIVTGEVGDNNVVKSKLVTVNQAAPAAPSITVEKGSIEIAAGGENDRKLSFNYESLSTPTFEICFFESDGITTATYDWVTTATIENEKVNLSVAANDGEARAAYFKVHAVGTEVYSNLVTITQQANNVTPTPSGDQFVKITSTNDLTDGDYLIVYEEGNLAFNGGLNPLDAASNTISVTIKDGAIAKDNTTSAALFTIAAAEKGYTIKSASGRYIGQITDVNGLKESETDVYTNTISFADGNADIVGTGGAYLRYNATSGQERFRYFKSATYTGQKAIALYKLAGAPDTRLDPELAFSKTSVDAILGENFTAPTLTTATGFNGAVEYSSSNEKVAQIMDIETGELRIVGGGTTTITASFAGDANYKKGSASYTLTVTDTRIATTTTQENIVLNISEVGSLTRLAPVVKDADGNPITYQYDEFPTEMSFDIVNNEKMVIGSLSNNTGEIELNSVAGTATLKAYYNSFNANDTYQPSECTFTITVVDPNAPGGQKNPYTVADAITYINGLNGATSPADVYVSGIVSQAPTAAPTSDGQLTYYISDDGTTTTQLQVYKGLGLDGAAFTAQDDIQVGDEVTVVGKVKLYGKTPEFDTGNRLYAFNRPAPQSFAVNWNTDENVTLYVFGADLSEALENGDEVTSGTTVMISPDYAQGYMKDVLTVVDAAGNNITLNASDESGAWTFTMPKSEVTITATSKDASAPITYYALVAQYDGKFFAVNNTFSSKAYGATEVDAVNGKVISQQTDALSWMLDSYGNGYGLKNKATNNYIGGSSSSADMTKSTTIVQWLQDDEGGFYIGTRYLLYRNSYEYFKNFANGNINADGYSGKTTAYTFADGYTRTVKAGSWGTFCVDHNIAAGDFSGVKFYNIAGKDKAENPTSITLEEVTMLEPGVPYLFQADAEATKLVAAYGEDVVKVPTSKNGLYGSLEGQAVSEGMYLLSGGQIVKCGTGCSIGANRAYINMGEVPVVSADVKGITFYFNGEVGVGSLNADNVNASTIYDLTGRRVSHARKGLYIVNGKKVSVK